MKVITVEGVECAVVSVYSIDALVAVCGLAEQLSGETSACGMCPAARPGGRSECALGAGYNCAAVKAAATLDFNWVCVPVSVYPMLKVMAAPGVIEAATYKGEKP